MWRNILRNLLFGLVVLNTISIGIKNFNPAKETNVRSNQELNQNSVNSRMTYGRFLEYLEMGWIKQVDLYDNSRNAIVEASSPELGKSTTNNSGGYTSRNLAVNSKIKRI